MNDLHRKRMDAIADRVVRAAREQGWTEAIPPSDVLPDVGPALSRDLYRMAAGLTGDDAESVLLIGLASATGHPEIAGKLLDDDGLTPEEEEALARALAEIIDREGDR